MYTLKTYAAAPATTRAAPRRLAIKGFTAPGAAAATTAGPWRCCGAASILLVLTGAAAAAADEEEVAAVLKRVEGSRGALRRP
jgi:hypothetical protein